MSGWFSFRTRASSGAVLSGPILEWKGGWSLLHTECLMVLCSLGTRPGQCPEQAVWVSCDQLHSHVKEEESKSTPQLLPSQM